MRKRLTRRRREGHGVPDRPGEPGCKPKKERRFATIVGTTVAGSAGFISLQYISLQIVSGVCKLTTDNATDNAKEQPVAAESSPGFLRWNGPDRTNVL